MTPCLLLTLTSPPVPAAASVRDASEAAGPRRGWADPGQDRSGPWLRCHARRQHVRAPAADIGLGDASDGGGTEGFLQVGAIR
jgi:hypothetical protein